VLVKLENALKKSFKNQNRKEHQNIATLKAESN
jgi:hypothetical protein